MRGRSTRELGSGLQQGPADRRCRSGWSKARLSAALAASRTGHARVAGELPLADEIDYFAAVGTRHDLGPGVTVARRGASVDQVHLVERGALAVIGEHGGRRPIVAFAVQPDICCAVPALLGEPAPWDAVTVMNTAVITVSATNFTDAVRERWVERWSTRTLSWLAEVGARVADLDERDLDAQVAALLLRDRGEHSVGSCRRTIADLLDIDDATAGRVLDRFERFGAVRFDGGRVAVCRPQLLRERLRGVQRDPDGLRGASAGVAPAVRALGPQVQGIALAQ